MTTTVITGIGELVTNDPARADQGGLLGLVTTPRSWSRAAGSPGSGRPPRRLLRTCTSTPVAAR